MTRYNTRPKVLVITEGYTEKNYFERFRERDVGYELIVRKSPENTPNKIFRFCVSQINDLGINLKKGDYAFCVFDIDYNKEDSINKVLTEARKKGIAIILSKPCFEIYFLLHFTKKVHHLSTPKETKQEMNTYIPNYSETVDYWDLLLPMKKDAIERCRGYTVCEQVDLDKLGNGSNIYLFTDRLDELKKSLSVH